MVIDTCVVGAVHERQRRGDVRDGDVGPVRGGIAVDVRGPDGDVPDPEVCRNREEEGIVVVEAVGNLPVATHARVVDDDVPGGVPHRDHCRVELLLPAVPDADVDEYRLVALEHGLRGE